MILLNADNMYNNDLDAGYSNLRRSRATNYNMKTTKMSFAIARITRQSIRKNVEVRNHKNFQLNFTLVKFFKKAKHCFLNSASVGK